MIDHERAMLAYVRLADVSQRKRQLLGRDKLLVLAAAAACRAGWLDVAQRCRQLILEHNPPHLIGTVATVAEALRSNDVAPLFKQLERQCGYERAEFLANELGLTPDAQQAADAKDAGQIAMALLSSSAAPSQE
jgi:hypothetical protein